MPVCLSTKLLKSNLISVAVSAFTIISLVGLNCFAQIDSSVINNTIKNHITLDSVVISAQHAPDIESELLRVVHVVQAEEIRNSPVNDLAGLLEYVRGIDIRQRGTDGAQADISIRGSSFDQIVILLNGINISDPQTGHHNLNIPIDVSSIERIEILEGSGARTYGPNAFAGAINIITYLPEKSPTLFSLRGGLYGSAEISANMPFKIKSTRHLLSVSASTTDGYTSNSDFKRANVYYRTNIKTKKTKTDFQAGFINKRFGANSFYSPKYPNQYEKTSTLFTSAEISSLKNSSWHANIYWRRHYDCFELFRNNPPGWYKNHNYHLSDAAGSTFNKSFSWRNHKTTIGTDLRLEHIFSNVLGDNLKVPVPVQGADSVFYTKSAQRNSISILAEHRYFVNNFSIAGGLLFFINKQLNYKQSLYPGIDIAYQISPKLGSFVSANRSLRLPNFTNLYYSSPTNIGNPLLKPEEAVSIEGGFKWNNNGVRAEILGFGRFGNNMIDWIRSDTAIIWESKNLTMVNVNGIETGISFMPCFFPKKCLLQQISINYSFYNSNKSSEGFVSLYVLDYIKHKLDVKATNLIAKNLNLTWQISWQDRAGGYTPFADGAFLPEVEYKPVVLVDASLFYQLQNLKFSIDCTNLFNIEIIDHANVPQPGFMLMCGISLMLEQNK